MKKIHIALSVDSIEESVADYSARLGVQPSVEIPSEYALWRTDNINFSIRKDSTCTPGTLRHLGFEDPGVNKFTQESDINGVIWESFNKLNQADEIKSIWPETDYDPSNN